MSENVNENVEKITKKELEELLRKAKEYDKLQKEIAELERAEKETELQIKGDKPDDEEFYCGECHAVVKKGQKFCHQCGVELEW